jgi:hypothetical protein
MSTKLGGYFLQPVILVFGWLISGAGVFAQMGSWAVAERDLGRPARPPFITFLGIAAREKMVTDPSLPPNGPVLEVLYEELRVQKTPAGPAGEIVDSIRTKYDEQGRVIEESHRTYGPSTKTIRRYDGTRLISEEATFPESKTPQAWNYWKYDERGKLIDYRRGRGEELQNHETGFTRDPRGRLTGYEYHQGNKDSLLTRTEFRYSLDGKVTETINYNATGEVTDSPTQTTDVEGHVVHVVIKGGDRGTKTSKPPLSITFKYDAKGRLAEQNVDPYDFEPAGGEHELPPGKVSIAYDDVKHTKRRRRKAKKLELSMTE